MKSDTKKSKKTNEFLVVSRFLIAQGRLVADISESSDVQAAFQLVASFLSHTSRDELLTLLNRPVAAKRDKSDEAFETLSLDEIEGIIGSDGVSRRQLERIAIGRFHVPQGSMRSFPTLKTLREKLASLVENEKTHAAIGNLAGRDLKTH